MTNAPVCGWQEGESEGCKSVCVALQFSRVSYHRGKKSCMTGADSVLRLMWLARVYGRDRPRVGRCFSFRGLQMF